MPRNELAPAFTLEGARAAGYTKDQIYSLLRRDQIERVGRGVYIRPESLQPEFIALATATALHEDATLCLTSALVYHDLSDAIPFTSDIALPRGTHRPVGLSGISWHHFDTGTFNLGREETLVPGSEQIIGIYSAERTIVDCFRLMHQEGSDVAHEALRRWLHWRGNTPVRLLKVAGSFPKALPRIRQALEVLF